MAPLIVTADPDPNPNRSADLLVRYQITGESARRGTNIRPDPGGGWMNGRGDDTQTMFVGYGHIVESFTGFDWWKSNPYD